MGTAAAICTLVLSTDRDHRSGPNYQIISAQVAVVCIFCISTVMPLLLASGDTSTFIAHTPATVDTLDGKFLCL